MLYKEGRLDGNQVTVSSWNEGYINKDGRSTSSSDWYYGNSELRGRYWCAGYQMGQWLKAERSVWAGHCGYRCVDYGRRPRIIVSEVDEAETTEYADHSCAVGGQRKARLMERFEGYLRKAQDCFIIVMSTLIYLIGKVKGEYKNQ